MNLEPSLSGKDIVGIIFPPPDIRSELIPLLSCIHILIPLFQQLLIKRRPSSRKTEWNSRTGSRKKKRQIRNLHFCLRQILIMLITDIKLRKSSLMNPRVSGLLHRSLLSCLPRLRKPSSNIFERKSLSQLSLQKASSSWQILPQSMDLTCRF